MPATAELDSFRIALDAGRFAHHGGRIAAARTLFPDAPQRWVDLSTGINRRSYPAPRATSAQRNRLPEASQLVELEARAANTFHVDDPARVVALPGTELALRLLPQVLALREAAVLGPTYSSHADAWTRVGSNTLNVDEPALQSCLDRSCTDQSDTDRPLALTVVNPNNPDGRVLSRERLLDLHERLAHRGGALIVDEAFADTDPSISVADIAGSEEAARLIVLRSFGKFYGLAGVRLGFIVASPAIAGSVRNLMGEWPISADALAAGRAAYGDRPWAERMRVALNRSARRLDTLLGRSGFQVVGGTSLYRLARAANAQQRFLHLLHASVLTRPFDHDHTLLRFGLPHGRAEWERLATALGSDHD
ncbi:MAG TPA: threonine-phosphate decarboxylase CobD [Steroidobacteraceae bacterium]